MLRVEHGKGHGSASWRTFEGISCARHRRASARSRQWSGEQRKKRKSGGQRGRRGKKRRNNCCVAVAIGCKSNKNARNGSVKGGEGGRDIKVSGGGSETRRRKKERERDRVVWRKRVAALLSEAGTPRKTGVIIKKVGGLLSRRHFIH